MIHKVLKLMRENGSFNEEYTKALSELWRLHVLEFLRIKAQPQIISLGKDVQIQATQAARSAGYNEALDDLTDFIEKFLGTPLAEKKLTPDYGGLDLAVGRGDLDQEEANELKNTGKSGPATSNA